MRRTSHLPINLIKMALFTLALTGCNRNDDFSQVPPHILPIDSFAQIMTDFAIAESATNMNIGNQPVFRLDTAYAFNPVQEHGISRARLDSSMAFYARHPERYEKVYQIVLDNLNALKKIEK